MPQSKISVWILILTLLMSLAACGGSSSGPGGNHELKPDPITTPDSFSFAPQEGLTLGELVESNTITLGGITAAASISISNGEYKLGDGDYTDEDGRIEPEQSLTVRTTAPESANTTKEVVVTVGGVSGRFVVSTMEDSEPPTASIVFPNVISATENTELTIRGTAEDALSEIARVTLIVNGAEEYEVESEDNFASWQAKVTLTPGAEHTITVSVEDEYGNVDAEAATAVVHQQEWDEAFPDDEHVFERAEGMTYDEEGHRVFVGDWNTNSVITVDLFTGKRNEFFKGEGGGVDGAAALVIDRPQNRLLVVNERSSTVYSLNLDGELQPTLLTSRDHTSADQPLFSSPRGIALDPQNPNRAFVTAAGISRNLSGLDLSTGLRTLLSDSETPDGENPFAEPRGLLVDHSNDRILVGSWSGGKVVISVDIETGERAIFSGAGIGGGDVEFWCPHSLGSDQLSERVLVGDCDKGIISVDINSGERTVITEIIHRRDYNHGMFLYVEEGWQVLYYVDTRHRALLMLDLETKEHVILSKGVSPD